jgi:hypothetical protein
MTITLTLQGAQQAAGAPIALSAGQRSTSNSDTFPDLFLGVTTTSTPPATFGGLAHADAAPPSAAVWDTSNDQALYPYSGGVLTNYSDVTEMRMLKRLDSNYVAGRYVWLLGFASGSPAGGDAPTVRSNAYLIR